MATRLGTVAAIFALSLLVMVVAAHEGHEHTPGMVMSPTSTPTPSPAKNSSTLVSPSMAIGLLLAFIVSLLVARERV
ncbi:hypothetical protein JCGZ_21767 [Jatropha curcas]|uniref:Uncharacterized protein n=1 Tax=Jatropha curcas TaxID=180498 RepID=A0A067JBU4_JATCU|nr:hypothetical protein JCGZ_21767 [Jatropha curcas]